MLWNPFLLVYTKVYNCLYQKKKRSCHAASEYHREESCRAMPSGRIGALNHCSTPFLPGLPFSLFLRVLRVLQVLTDCPRRESCTSFHLLRCTLTARSVNNFSLSSRRIDTLICAEMSAQISTRTTRGIELSYTWSAKIGVVRSRHELGTRFPIGGKIRHNHQA
jgi:hypothetical protein